MTNLRVPAVVLPRGDHSRLVTLVQRLADDKTHSVASFLAQELDRARVTSDRAVLGEVARLNCWVSYRIDWGPTKTLYLVHPDDYVDKERQLCVISPAGAAMIGIGIADRMPFIDSDGTPHLVTVVNVSDDANVIPLRLRGANAARRSDDEPFDPGPSAA